MKEKLELLKDTIDMQADIKEDDKDVCILGVVAGQELGRMNSIHNSRMNRLNENRIELFKNFSVED